MTFLTRITGPPRVDRWDFSVGAYAFLMLTDDYPPLASARNVPIRP